MPDEKIVDSAVQWFDNVTVMQHEDAQLRRLRYHLLRLTALGAKREDVPALLELGRLAFQGAPVADQVADIETDPDSSVLARVIAGIVGNTASRGGPTRQVMLGAVLGSYLAVGHSQSADEVSVHGAVAGAGAAWAAALIEELLSSTAQADYLNPSEA